MFGSAMSRRILSLWLPRLATEVVERRRGMAAGQALVVVDPIGRGVVVAAVNRAAAAAGLGPGMTLADARAVVPGLVAVTAQSGPQAATLERLADGCGRYTPWLAVAAPDGLVLDITGCAHLFGGEDRLVEDLTRRLKRAGFTARVAVADTPGAAWAGARWRPAIIPSGTQRAFLADLPVAALGLPATVAAGLARVGLRRIGELYPVPRRSLAARFGIEVGRRLDRALGAEDEPISPRRPGTVHAVRLAFAEPIATAEAIAGAVRRLLTSLCAGLEKAGQGARRLELSCFSIDAGCDQPPQEIAIGTSRPVRKPAALLTLLAERLETIAPGAGLEVLVLAASVVEPLAAVQPGLGGGLGDGDAGDDDLGGLVDRLGLRLGPVRRPLPHASWWPEHAVAWVPALESVGESVTGVSWPADRPRPLRLLERPEPIEVTAPVPDDPPLLFRWRGTVHRVAKAEGPERLEPEWWRGPAELRDYYRVEDADGRRFWLFRSGRYQPDRVAPWFLHGFFG